MDYTAQRDYVNENNPFMRLCGVTVVRVGKDEAEGELAVEPQRYNPGGTLHGGAFFTLADAVASAAARSDGFRWTTVDGDIHYHRAATEGVVRGTAKVRRRGRSLCTAAVEIADGRGVLLADAVFTMFRLERMDHVAFRD